MKYMSTDEKFHLGACRHLQHWGEISKMFFSIVLRKPVWNLYDCIFVHVTSTHAVNVSARPLWIDFTVCSIIHNSRHQLHVRHEQQLPNSWNLYISVQCLPTPCNRLFTSLHSGCLPTRLPHVNDFSRHVNRTVQWRLNGLSRFGGPSLDM